MNPRLKRTRRAAPTRLRAHHFLCLYGFRGLGYSDDFVRNMTAVVESVEREPQRLVEAVEVPDDICRACPHLQNGGCTKKDEESEGRVREHDRRILRRLAIDAGQLLPARQVFRRVEQHISPEDLADLCAGCEWLPLGYCQEGLRSRQQGIKRAGTPLPPPGDEAPFGGRSPQRRERGLP